MKGCLTINQKARKYLSWMQQAKQGILPSKPRLNDVK